MTSLRHLKEKVWWVLTYSFCYGSIALGLAIAEMSGPMICAGSDTEPGSSFSVCALVEMSGPIISAALETVSP